MCDLFSAMIHTQEDIGGVGGITDSDGNGAATGGSYGGQYEKAVNLRPSSMHTDLNEPNRWEAVAAVRQDKTNSTTCMCATIVLRVHQLLIII